MMDGHRCNAVALTGKPYCHFHNRHYQRNTPADPDYELPIFEDSRSILLGIRQLIEADLSTKLDPSQVTRLLYAYQIAASIVHRPDGMGPEALEQLEQRLAARVRVVAEAKIDAQTKLMELRRQEEEEQKQLDGPSPIEMLLADLKTPFDTPS
jgi:hypothetical protein